MNNPPGDPLRSYVEGIVRDVLGETLDKLLAERGFLSHAAFLSTNEAAEYARVTPDTIRRWKDAGALPAHTAGRELRFRRDELDQFMATRKRGARKKPQKVRALSPEALALRELGLDV